MKNLFLLMSFFGLAAFSVITDLPIGSALPMADLKLQDVVSGKEISMQDAKKKNGLLVMFSCNTCPVVVVNQRRTLDIAAFAQQQDIGVILINSNEAQRSSADSKSEMQQYAKKQGYKWHYVVDNNSAVADAFNAKRTPETFLFDKNGKLVYHGAIDDNPNDPGNVERNHLKEAINELVGGKEVRIKTSRSVGCSIKRL